MVEFINRVHVLNTHRMGAGTRRFFHRNGGSQSATVSAAQTGQVIGCRGSTARFHTSAVSLRRVPLILTISETHCALNSFVICQRRVVEQSGKGECTRFHVLGSDPPPRTT